MTVLAEVGAVRLDAVRRASTGPLVVAGVGLLGAAGGLWSTLAELADGSTWAPLHASHGLDLLIAGLLVTVAALLAWRRDRFRWRVVATTPQGDRVVLLTTDPALAEHVFTGLDEARAEATSPRRVLAWPA